MKFLLTPFLFFGFASLAQVYAAAFTADAVQVRGENISHAKMYWLDGNVRFEYTEDGVSMVQIFDNKNNKTIWLDNDNKYYLERDLPDSEKITAKTNSKKNTDPCKQFFDAECVFLKKTKMNGRLAEKWLITLNDNGKDFHVFQWVDSTYKIILRQENSDGTGLSVEVQDDQEINNRKVRKLTMVAFSSSGLQKQGTQWYDSELDIVVKQEYQNDVIDELRNIKVGKVSEKLFIRPKDYSLFNGVLKTEEKSVDAAAAEMAGKK